MATNATLPEDRETGAPAQNVLTRLSERFGTTANAKNVYGDPIEAHGRTVIPIAKIGYGLGGSRGGTDGSRGGAGGGVGAKPAGYIEITDQGTRYVAFAAAKTVVAAAVAGLVAGWLVGRMGR